MTNFTFTDNNHLEYLKTEFPFIKNNKYEIVIDAEEENSIGLVIAHIAKILNHSEEARVDYLDDVLSSFEKLSCKDVTFQNYIITEFLENIRFEVSNINDFPIIAELRSKYM